MLIQRLGTNQLDEAFTDGFIQTVKNHPGSCDEVWLASLYGYPPIDIHNDYGKKLSDIAKKFRAGGIEVSLQISNTIGHGQYVSKRDCSGLVYDGSMAENLMGHDGVVAEYAFCWRGENFRQYILDSVRAYMAIQPHCVWIDDDFRACNHSPVEYGCFCDSCMTKFNEKYGSDFTREELVEAINYGDEKWRRYHVEFTREGIAELAYLIAGTVNELSPDSFMGYQHGAYGGYTGYGDGYIYDAFLKGTGKAPKTRPGGGAYNDHDPNVFLTKCKEICFQNSMLPDYVTDIYPEIESLPDVKYGKSISGTLLETSVYLAAGSTGMTYAIMQGTNEPDAWYYDTLKAFSTHRAYWDKLIEYNKNSYAYGLSIASSESMWQRQYNRDEGVFKYGYEPIESACELMILGIPLSRGKRAGGTGLLHYENTIRMSDDEIISLMKTNLVTDGASLKYLSDKGFEFSAKAKEINLVQMYERYFEHEINKDCYGDSWNQSFFMPAGYEIVDVNGKTEPFAVYDTDVDALKSDDKYACGIANAIVETEYGAKWAVFGHNLWNNVISSDKRNQIIRAADYIADDKLKAYVATPVQCVVFPRVNKDGKICSVSVLNTTVGHSGEVQLRLRNPISGNFYMMGQYCQRQEVDLEISEDSYIISIPDIAPWSMVTVFAGV